MHELPLRPPWQGDGRGTENAAGRTTDCHSRSRDRHAGQCAHLSLDREGVLTRLMGPSDLVPLSASTKQFVGHVPRVVFELYGTRGGR